MLRSALAILGLVLSAHAFAATPEGASRVSAMNGAHKYHRAVVAQTTDAGVVAKLEQRNAQPDDGYHVHGLGDRKI